MKKGLIFFFVSLALLLTSACTRQVQGERAVYEAENIELLRQIGEFEAQLNLMQERFQNAEAEIASLQQKHRILNSESEDKYEAMLREIFNEQELKELAIKKGMVYGLSVNKIPVTGPDVIVKPAEMLEIAVSEGMVMKADGYNSLLPNKILQLAMLANLKEHIELETDAEYFTSGSAGTIVWGEGFFFENAGSGTTVKVVLSEVLRERIGLKSREVMVRVK